MITREPARAIGDQAGVEYVASGVLPDGKRKPDKGTWKLGKVAMVGDGINDAPGTHSGQMLNCNRSWCRCSGRCRDVVLRTAVYLMSPELYTSRATLRNIHENLFLGIFL